MLVSSLNFVNVKESLRGVSIIWATELCNQVGSLFDISREDCPIMNFASHND